MPRIPLIAAALLAGIAVPSVAQQPPVGLPPAELPREPQRFATAEQPEIEVTVLARGLPRPFAIEFLPEGDMLISQRGGDLLRLRATAMPQGEQAAEAVRGMPLPPADTRGMGVQDIVVRSGADGVVSVLFTYNEAVADPEAPGEPPKRARLELREARYADGALHDIAILFSGDISSPSGSRIALAPDGSIWITTGAPFGNGAQDLSSIYGKVLRLDRDGRPHPGNPFAGREGAASAIYSYGHRDQLGLTVHPSGAVFAAEHGPNGGDEVNLIQPGGNYGWPGHSWGRNYDGTPIGGPAQVDGVVDPVAVWIPSIAPNGLLFYTGEAFPQWKGNLFVGSARWGEINGTGSLQRVVFNAEFGELRREALLQQLHQRVRDVTQGPDGLIYVLTDGPENAVLRIAPGG